MKGIIPRPFIDDLLAKANIIDVINSRIKLKKAGRDYQACCPFHHEKTPSFTVSEKKQFFHCFGCGAHGNSISFLMEYDKLEFVEAVEELAGLVGLDVPYEQKSNYKNKPQLSYQAKRNLYELMDQISAFYQSQLKQSPQALDYIKQRGLSSEVIQRFQIGYVPNQMDSVLRQFAKNAEEQQKLLDLGMLSRNDRGTVYDKFRHRLMFPIRDKRGRTIAFGGRVLGDEKPKYLNSPETITYHKGKELYGLFEALQVNDSPNLLVVVEGYMDVVALAQFGVDYAVASLGTSTTSEQIQLLFRSCEQIVCCYDGDKAGREAAWRALENALPYLEDGCQLKFVFLPEGEDPDSYIRQYGKQAFEQQLNQAQTLTEFLLARLSPQVDFSTKEGKSKLIALSAPLIKQIPGEMLRLSLRNGLAEKLGLLDQTQLERFIPSQNPSVSHAKPVISLRKTPMRVLIALLLQNSQLAKLISEEDIILLQQEPGYPLLSQLFHLCYQREGITTGQMLEYFRESEYAQIVETLAMWELLIPPDIETSDYLIQNYYRLNLQAIERNIATIYNKELQQRLTFEEKQVYQTLIARRAKIKSLLTNDEK